MRTKITPEMVKARLNYLGETCADHCTKFNNGTCPACLGLNYKHACPAPSTLWKQITRDNL